MWNVRPRVRECQTITDCFKDLFLKEKSVRSMLSYRLAQGGLFILFIMSGVGSLCVHMCVCMYARVLTQKAEENTRCLTLETVSLTEPHSSRVRGNKITPGFYMGVRDLNNKHSYPLSHLHSFPSQPRERSVCEGMHICARVCVGQP